MAAALAVHRPPNGSQTVPPGSENSLVQAVLRDGLALRDRSNAGEISEHGLASARGRLAARLGRLIDTAPGAVAAADLTRDHCGLDGLFGPPVGGVDPAKNPADCRAQPDLR